MNIAFPNTRKQNQESSSPVVVQGTEVLSSATQPNTKTKNANDKSVENVEDLNTSLSPAIIKPSFYNADDKQDCPTDTEKQISDDENKTNIATTSQPWWSKLPPGWSTTIDPKDGRMYYIQMSTGRTSWTHPNAPRPHQRSRNGNYGNDYYNNWDNNNTLDTPLYSSTAGRCPDNHQCMAVTSLLLCFPIGLLAMYHSYMVDRQWDKGKHGDAINHSKQASNYSQFAICVGIVLVIIWIIRANDFDFGEMFDFKD